MGASEKDKGSFLEGQQGPRYSENYMMHKVEVAGHAGTESPLPSRLPVLKLLTGRAAVGGPGARSPGLGGPEPQEARGPRGWPSTEAEGETPRSSPGSGASTEERAKN